MQGFITYLKNVRAEMKHVVWPTQKQATTHVILILLMCAFGIALIAALDFAFTTGLSYLISR